MLCPRCHTENREGRRFCGECGLSFAATCPSCGFLNEGNEKFCGGCGQQLVSPPGPTAASHAHRAQDSSISLTETRAEAERRQLTVMFCDLVGSTELATRLDPEVLREVVRAYQHAASGVISGLLGHVAQYLGDGLLVYFGYPAAHEDDAQRAIRAGLGIIAAMESLNVRLRREHGTELAVRVGVHTGLVVVGEMGAGGRREELALGETPNVAARLQAMAEPDTVLISAATHRLVHDAFVCVDLGAHAVKGLPEPVAVYRVQDGVVTLSPLEISAGGRLTPLVGREQEVGLLVSRWEQAKDGLGQGVLLSGEPGIGKSRLVRVLKEHVAREPHTRWECRGSTYHQESALFPIIDLFERALEFGREDAAEAKRRKIETALARYGLAQPEAITLWASLLSVPLTEPHPPLNLTPQRQKQKTFEAIVALLLALSAEQPVVFIVEDLHWVDPSTLELLELVLGQVPSAPILVVLTCRPEFQSPWGTRTHLTHLTVTRFTRKQTEVMVEHVTGGKTLPAEVLQQMVAKTDGVPLFVEELTKMVLESGLVREREDRYELGGALPPLAIPSTLQDSLMARLDRLAAVKDVAQLGAALGRTFSYELLQAVASIDDMTLERSLTRLVEAELLYQRGMPPDATYIFKHALIQETAYQSMLISRRRQLHQRIAHVLTARFPETADTQPEVLAHHYTAAGLTDEAIGYWYRAGERAVRRSGNHEAIGHFTRALGLLSTLPDDPDRRRRELDLQTALGPPLMATKGYAAPDVERTFARARELCREVGEAPQLALALWGLYGFYLLRGQVEVARDLGEQLLALAEREGDPALFLLARRTVGTTLFFLGEFVEARRHLDMSIAVYEPEQHRSLGLVYGQDLGTTSRDFASHALWHLGYPDQALSRTQESLSLAREHGHALSVAHALGFDAWLHQYRREGRSTLERADADIAYAAEHGIAHFSAHGTIFRGWALVEQGLLAEGLAELRRGLSAYRTMGAELERPHWLALLAEAHLARGDAEEGLTVVTEALAEVQRTGARWNEAELHRLKGELLLKRGIPDDDEAERCFRQALEIARAQSAKSLELRAAVSSSRLLHRQGKRDDARRLLAEIYDWFTEGFATRDLREAKSLLDGLSHA